MYDKTLREGYQNTAKLWLAEMRTLEKILWPPCECGHSSEEHHYSPSGCGGSHCEYGGVCECGHYELDHTFPGCGEECKCEKPNIVVPYCNCQEYSPPE